MNVKKNYQMILAEGIRRLGEYVTHCYFVIAHHTWTSQRCCGERPVAYCLTCGKTSETWTMWGYFSIQCFLISEIKIFQISTLCPSG